MTAVRARCAAALLLAASVAVACGSRQGAQTIATTGSTVATATTQPPVTSAPSTVPVTEPATTAAPTTSGAITEGFLPSCVETQRPDASSISLEESALARFGPLQAEPSMRITLPQGVSKYAPDPQTTSVDPVRVPGGLLLNVRSSSYGYFPGSMLAAVDDDGVVRWIRCLDDMVAQVYVAPATKAPDTALVAVHLDQGNELPLTDYLLVSLADGRTIGSLADHLAAQGIDGSANLAPWPVATTETKLLFGLPGDTIVDTRRDHLLLVDLVSLTGALLPFPAFSNGTQMMYNGFDFDGRGDPYLVGSEDGKRIALRSYHDGAWSEGPSRVVSASAITVDFEFGLGPTLVATGVDGADVWRRDDIYTPGGEGFRVATSGDVTVVAGCQGAADPQNNCPHPLLAGIRTTDGSTAWMLDGWRGVGAVGDGYAIITDFDMSQPDANGGWFMIDTDTGRAVDGQQWSGTDTFRQGCCGESEFVHVRMFGGILVAVAERDVAIYFPQGLGPAPRVVDLN